jgi:hypothetical protein
VDQRDGWLDDLVGCARDDGMYALTHANNEERRVLRTMKVRLSLGMLRMLGLLSQFSNRLERRGPHKRRARSVEDRHQGQPLRRAAGRAFSVSDAE